MEFKDVASALIAAQDEVDRWTTALRDSGVQSEVPQTEQAKGYAAPLAAWTQTVQDLNIFRRHPRGSSDYDVEQPALVLITAPVGLALLWTLRMLGQEGAHAAAIAAGLTGGGVDWSDDAQFKGVLAFERFLQRRLDHEEEEGAKRPAAKINDLLVRADALEGRLEELAKIMSQAIKRTQDEDTVHRAETVVAWRSVKEQAEHAQSQINDDIAELRDKVKALCSAEQAELVSRGERIDSVLRDQAADNAAVLRQALTDGQSTLENWIKANIEQRQLAKPARLWAARAKSHARRAGVLRWWVIGVGVLGLIVSAAVGYAAFRMAGTLFADAIVPGASLPAPGTLRPTFHYQLIFTGLTTLAALTMYLWGMRVLVRLYTTEHHLSIDASARGAMNDTYIGLVAAGAANEQDRPTVLAALFRPVQDGIVKDDGPPSVSPAAMLSGFLGGTSK